MFLKAYNENQEFNLKTQIGNASNLDFHGINFGRYARCDAIYISF